MWRSAATRQGFASLISARAKALAACRSCASIRLNIRGTIMAKTTRKVLAALVSVAFLGTAAAPLALADSAAPASTSTAAKTKKHHHVKHHKKAASSKTGASSTQ
jgi:hypothetical protein